MSDAVETQPRNLPLHATAESTAGGTYIVTGANTGLGLEAAKHLVNLGAAKVILAVRNLTAGEAARARILEETGKGADSAEVWSLDLSSYDSVKAFANKAIAELDRIDALIENAAVAAGAGTAEENAACLTVNVYSTLLLAALLFPKLTETAQRFGITPHLTVVTSGASFDTKEKWVEIKDDPLVKMNGDGIGMALYPLSKLLEIFFVRQLTTLVPVSKTGVVVNLVNPGLCITELARNAPPQFQQRLKKMHAEFGRTAEDGSRTLLHGAVAGKDSHGCYLSDCTIADDRLPNWITDTEGKKSQELVFSGIIKELESIAPGSTKSLLQG